MAEQHVRVYGAADVRGFRRTEPSRVPRYVLVHQCNAGVSIERELGRRVRFVNTVYRSTFQLSCCPSTLILDGTVQESYSGGDDYARHGYKARWRVDLAIARRPRAGRRSVALNAGVRTRDLVVVGTTSSFVASAGSDLAEQAAS